MKRRAKPGPDSPDRLAPLRPVAEATPRAQTLRPCGLPRFHSPNGPNPLGAPAPASKNNLTVNGLDCLDVVPPLRYHYHMKVIERIPMRKTALLFGFLTVLILAASVQAAPWMPSHQIVGDRPKIDDGKVGRLPNMHDRYTGRLANTESALVGDLPMRKDKFSGMRTNLKAPLNGLLYNTHDRLSGQRPYMQEPIVADRPLVREKTVGRAVNLHDKKTAQFPSPRED